jgi:hypothetical protein
MKLFVFTGKCTAGVQDKQHMLSGYKGALGCGFLQELPVTAHFQRPSVRTDCG